jgi:hypothetical protein
MEVTFVAPHHSRMTLADRNNTEIFSDSRSVKPLNLQAGTFCFREFVYHVVSPVLLTDASVFLSSAEQGVDLANLSRLIFVSTQWENSTAQRFETSSPAVTQSMAAFKFAQKNDLLESLALIKNIIAAVVGTALNGLRVDLDDESEPGAYPTIRLEIHLQGTVEEASECDDAIQRKIVDNVPAPQQMFFSLDYQFV